MGFGGGLAIPDDLGLGLRSRNYGKSCAASISNGLDLARHRDDQALPVSKESAGAGLIK